MLPRRVSALAVVFLGASLCVLVSAQPAAADPADQVAIDRAVDWGVKFLKKEQKPSGYWGDSTGPGLGVGYTALAGLTLAECGVPVTDPGLKRAANVIRANAHELDATYELVLAILFLDRMKDRNDKATIQLLAGRLISAQMASGGWGYKTQKLNSSDTTALLAALRKMTPPAEPKAGAAPFDPEKARKAALAGLPGALKRLPVLFDPDPQLQPDAKEKRQDLYDATTDNSNTHFAMVGLWAARKYDVPTDRTFARVNRRFRTSQGPGGTWSYDFVRGGADGTTAHTCVALLGIAIGHVVAPEPDVRPETDPIILNAFVALSKSIGEPAGTTANRPAVKDVGGLYFLWAMERIAVLYDIQKLNKKDWYLWGAEILLSHQLASGSWADDGGYPGQNPIPNTCFALLFLRRANLTPDLSKRLVVNPAVLTAKVDEKVAPKPAPPPPPTFVLTPIEVAPPPHAMEPKPQPAPAPSPPVVAPAPEPVATAPPAKKTPWLWIVLGTVLAGLVGGGLAFFAVVKRRKRDEDQEDEDEGARKKKKGKKKAKVRAEAEDDEE